MNNGTEYLKNKLRDVRVTSFSSSVNQIDSQVNLAKYNFLSNFKEQVSYEEFSDRFKKSPKHTSLKDESKELTAALLDDIKIPGFYKKLDAFHHLQLI